MTPVTAGAAGQIMVGGPSAFKLSSRPWSGRQHGLIAHGALAWSKAFVGEARREDPHATEGALPCRRCISLPRLSANLSPESRWSARPSAKVVADAGGGPSVAAGLLRTGTESRCASRAPWQPVAGHLAMVIFASGPKDRP
jgi:hypothetical protein